MRHEHHLVARTVVEDAVIVRPARAVTIPVHEQNLQRRKFPEALHVEHALELFQSVARIGLPRGGNQVGQIGVVLRIVAAVHLQRFRHVAAGAAVVKIASRRFKVALEELPVPAFDQ